MSFLWIKLLVLLVCFVFFKQLQFMQEFVRFRGRFVQVRGLCGILGIGIWLQSFFICLLKKFAQFTLNDVSVVLKVAIVIVEIWDRINERKVTIQFFYFYLRYRVGQLYDYDYNYSCSFCRYLIFLKLFLIFMELWQVM